jgi:hypothetical protein
MREEAISIFHSHISPSMWIKPTHRILKKKKSFCGAGDQSQSGEYAKQALHH